VKIEPGGTAAITGAGSGIGRALAEQLAARGVHLALSDVDEVGLAATVARCEGRGVKVTSARVDVADRAAVLAWADQVVEQHDRLDLVVNNAGVALAADVADMAFDDLDWLLGINLMGVINGTKAFLPHLEARGGGHVVNLSSVFGLVSIPSQSAYNAAKFAVRGFTDALRMELEIAGSPVSCTTVHPGGIKTNIARNARFSPQLAARAGGEEQAKSGFDKIAVTSPEKAARQILAAVEANKRRVLVGPDAKVIDLVSRLPASVTERLMILGAKRGGGSIV
jgi:butyryl-CoA dehydrogenase